MVWGNHCKSRDFLFVNCNSSFIFNFSSFHEQINISLIFVLPLIHCFFSLLFFKLFTTQITKGIKVNQTRGKILEFDNYSSLNPPGSRNHARPKRPCQTQASWVWYQVRPKRHGSGNHVKPKQLRYENHARSK